MKSSHSSAATFAAFDDPNLLAHGGLAPAVRLAERYGLPTLIREKVRLAGSGNAAGAATPLGDGKITLVCAAVAAVRAIGGEPGPFLGVGPEVSVDVQRDCRVGVPQTSGERRAA